jgi:signal peptidase I
MDESNLTREELRKRTARAEAYDWLQCIVSAMLICVLIFVFLARVVGVIGSSMNPTLNDGDMLIISDLFYTPKQGDIVVLRKESFKDEPLVKRVIAVAGQTVDIDFNEGVVYVDGVALAEDYTAEPTLRQLDFSGPVTVPEGTVFLMGDNRNDSTDSRSSRIGFVDVRYIMGKAYLLILPGADPVTEKKQLSRIGWLY